MDLTLFRIRHKHLTAEGRALKLLKQKGSAYNYELAKVAGFRYGSVIHRLRKEGNHIVTSQLKNGIYLYTLTDGV